MKISLPKIKLPRFRKTPTDKLKKSVDKYTKQLKKAMPVLLAFGLGLTIGLVQDRPSSNVTPSEQTADVQEMDLTGAEDFADRMVAMLRESQCSQMYSETSLGFRVNASEEDWLVQCSVAASVLTGDLESIEQEDSNVNDDVVEFSYRIEASDDKIYLVIIQSVFRDDGWKLQGISSQVQ